jgi:hypothetical protein
MQMSNLYSTVTNEKGASATQPAARELDAHISGWDIGVLVEARHNPDTKVDFFEVWLTGGSNNPSIKTHIGTFKKGDEKLFFHIMSLPKKQKGE